MKKRTTITDVARAAGVSIMTISRVINNKPGVSVELRQKILKVADELNYRPSKIARGLATQQTGTIGLVVPSISNPFYSEIAQSIEDVAFINDYSVFLINTAENLTREMAALNSLREHNIDGAILCSFRSPAQKILDCVEQIPAVVLFNRKVENSVPNVVTICVNDRRAAQEAVKHLIDAGRTRIAYISGPQDSFSSQRRLEGYCLALKKADIPFDPGLVIQIMPAIEEGREAAAILLSRHPDIDAILAFNDLVAIGAIQACQELGKNIPEDIAIIGADDIPMATLIQPKLTTSRTNLAHIGRLAMRILLEMFEGQTPPASHEIEAELIIRESG